MHQLHHHRTPTAHDLHVVCPITNPQRYNSRYRLFEQFRDEMLAAGVHLHVAEAALGARPHEVAGCGDLALRTQDEIWHKENLINLAIQRLPADWKYVAWIDGDVSFVRKDWAHETVQMLQHHAVVQMFQTAINTGPNGEAFATHEGFVSRWLGGRAVVPAPPNYPHGHPGFAWAATREAIDAVGGLFELGILGAGDHHMANALVGRSGDENTPDGLTDGYYRALAAWTTRAAALRANVGMVKGTLVHGWHGKLADRRYWDRWQILLQHKYDPDLDVQRDWQGLLRFSAAGARMRNDVRAYFQARNEDSVDR